MRYENDFSVSKAVGAVSERVCALPEFAHARSEVVTEAIWICRGRTVAEMRALGGFSEVIRTCIDRLPSKYSVDYGSKMFPRTVADELRARLPALREEVQFAIASHNSEPLCSCGKPRRHRKARQACACGFEGAFVEHDMTEIDGLLRCPRCGSS